MLVLTAGCGDDSDLGSGADSAGSTNPATSTDPEPTPSSVDALVDGAAPEPHVDQTPIVATEPQDDAGDVPAVVQAALPSGVPNDADVPAVVQAPPSSGVPNDADAPAVEQAPPSTGMPNDVDVPAVEQAPLSTGVPNAIDITVPPVAVETNTAVGFDEMAAFGDGVEVRIAAREAIEVRTVRPGEIGGPAVLLRLEFSNRSERPVDLRLVTVDLVLSDGASANQVTTPPAEPVSGVLGAGEQRLGDYVFAVSVDDRDPADLTVRYSAATPMVVFTGSLPDA